MWPFSSTRNPYRETIEAKRAHRADVLKLAPPFSAEQHQKYLNATGTVQWCFIHARACPPPSLALIFLLFLLGGPAASQIVENIEARTWTTSAVLEAYIARAAQVHQATNCLTEGTCAPFWSILLLVAYGRVTHCRGR